MFVNMDDKLRLVWWVALINYILVALFIGVQTLLKEPAASEPGTITFLWLGIKLFTWSLFTVTFIRKKPNGFILLCFASLLYFVFAGVEAFENHTTAIWARIEIVSLFLLFVSAMLFARWKSESLKQV